MKKFEFEQAHDIFVKKLAGKNINIDEYGFSREFEFYVRGVGYKVVWFNNMSTLSCGDWSVMFFSAEIANTWPTNDGAKNKLQLRDKQGCIVAVLTIEYYETHKSE